MKSPHSPRATQIAGMIIGLTATVNPAAVGKGANVIVTVTTVTTGHGVTHAPSCVVLHVTMIVTTDVVDVIKTVDVIRIAGATTTVDTTKAAGVTAEGTAAANATPMPWTRNHLSALWGKSLTSLFGLRKKIEYQTSYRKVISMTLTTF